MYNLFISHSWAYGNQYDNLINLLNSKPSFPFRDYSIPKNDPVHTNGSDQALKRAIYNKMLFCNGILILAGVYASYSKWINAEIEIAKNSFSSPKPIIAIKPFGNTNVSTKVSAAADKIVNWSTDSIVKAIQELF